MCAHAHAHIPRRCALSQYRIFGDPTDDSRMEHSIQCVLKVPDHTGTKRSERSGSLHALTAGRNTLTAGMNA